MDGLTIRNAEGLIQSGDTLREVRRGESLGAPTAGIEDSKEAGKTFAETLKDAVNSVNDMQKAADVATQKLATGQTDNIPEVMIAAEKADIALKLMVQMRNKVIDAYQEVMKMQF